jgi:ABC-type uncharacterized transport system substrate-binding protein
MRESRTYGSGRGACDETHVPTATLSPRVHHAARRRGGLAACGAGAAGRADAAHRRVEWTCRRYRGTLPRHDVPAGASGAGLDGRPQRSHRTSLGRRRCRPHAHLRGGPGGNETRAILAITTAALVPLRQATSSIPIVFVDVGDPAESGIVESLARPGGNITGITTFVSSIGGKWLELLKEVAPRVVRVLVILNRDNPTAHGVLRIIEASAPSFGIMVTQVSVHSADEIERAVENFARQPDTALLVLPDPATVVNRERIVALAAQHRIPAVYPFRYFVDSGGLMSYGTVPTDQYRQAASYVDRILKGANPGELPVQQPAKFELVVNKTAKALGLTIPESFLLRADQVIE